MNLSKWACLRIGDPQNGGVPVANKIPKKAKRGSPKKGKPICQRVFERPLLALALLYLEGKVWPALVRIGDLVVQGCCFPTNPPPEPA